MSWGERQGETQLSISALTNFIRYDADIESVIPNQENRGEKSTTSLDRRDILKCVGASTVVGGFSFTAPVVAGSNTSEDMVQIPTVKRGDTVVKWKQVPKSWYEHVQHSREVRKDIKNDFFHKEGIRAILLARWDKTFDGKNGLLIEAEVDPETYDGSLPRERDGIPVREIDAPDRILKNCCHHKDFDPVPGGVAVQTESGPVGSAGFCVENENGNRRLLTANHLWGGCEDNTDGQLNQHTDKFGKVRTIDKNTDYALVEPTSTEGLVYEVFVNGSRYRVSGWQTQNGVSDLISTGEDTYQTGGTSCTTSGPIKGQGDVGSKGCIGYEDHGIKADIGTAEGDSGGPFIDFAEYDGNRYASIITHQSLGDVSSTITCHWGEGGYGKPNYGPAFYHLTDSPHNLSLCT